jgi:transposase
MIRLCCLEAEGGIMTVTLPDARELPDEVLEAIRLRVLRGLEMGFSQTELAEMFGVRRETISRWQSAFTQGGLDALPGGRPGRPTGSGRLLSDEQAARIRQLIDDNLPEDLGLAHALWTRRAVGDLIRKEFDIDLADRSVGLYLWRWGYTSKKPARRAKKQEPDEVKEWLQETYPAIEIQAQHEDAQILFCDEVGAAADHHPGMGYARRGERARMAVPDPHIRVNQISAIGNTGCVHFMTYKGSFSHATFLVFLAKLVEGAAGKKILLIVDRLQAHKTPEVEEWLAEHKDEIEVFYLPRYSPERNPVEYLNNDMKGSLNKRGLPDDRPTLLARVIDFMTSLTHLPQHVISYFHHPCVQYAAASEL